MALLGQTRAAQYLWIVCICVAITGCASNIVTPQAVPLPAPGRPASSSNSAATELLIADLNSGGLSKLMWDNTAPDNPIAIHNGSSVLVELQTDATVTGVTVSGDALSTTALERTRGGHWRGTFQYWDLSNVLNSTSSITVELLSAKGPTEKAISVRTIHDS